MCICVSHLQDAQEMFSINILSEAVGFIQKVTEECHPLWSI